MIFLRLVLGFIGGLVATGPMSVVMVLLHRRLPPAERYPLPPHEITTKAMESVPEAEPMDPAKHAALTWMAHFGYGGAAGALYAGVQRWLPRPPAGGLLFGMLVWAFSYLGLLPGLRVLTSATAHPARRNVLMIVAHLVWGGVLAVIYAVLFSDLRRGDHAFRSSLRPPHDAVAGAGPHGNS
jgi:uncharacterized membrane protein YagU involved in acid resistance